MLWMLHVSTGELHEVSSPDGYALPDWQPLPTRPSGPAEHWLWTGTDWEKNIDLGLALLREHRDGFLDQTDKYMVSDRPISSEQRTLWEAYRQALRDLPENTLDPFNPEWPIAPE